MAGSALSSQALRRSIDPAVLQRRRHTIILIILVIALVAFEIFNFDSTTFALTNLLGDVRFIGVRWSMILATAFCGIDFAGLLHLFAPETQRSPLPEQWYLMFAWLLGATMNAIMTWYAISLTLLQHPIGNEVLSREDLLTMVPVFVAILVWLTRILFIGALSVMSDTLQADASGESSLERAVIRPNPDRD